MIESIERIEMTDDGVVIIKESLDDPIVYAEILLGLPYAQLLKE